MTRKDIIIPIGVYQFEELSKERQQLIKAAKEATSTSYAIYSNFAVGAAILLDNGEVVCGSNQENAAYPSGLCAERVTMFYANATYPASAPKIIAIAVQNSKGFLSEPIPPCGGCRQVLLESENRYNSAIEVLLYGTNFVYQLHTIKDLLPLSFGKEDLAG